MKAKLPYGTAWACAALSTLLVGCGAMFNTAYRSESNDNLKAIAVDAKQRFVFIKTEPNGTKSIVCPEPSPDALSAGSINLSVDASKSQIAELKAALASAEQASSIGLRTQSISLLRDQLAYMCLLRMADARAELDADAYLLLFKRYQAAVLGVLAIEQLTGAVRAPAVTVSATGSATVNVDSAKKPAAAASEPKQSGDVASGPDNAASAPPADDAAKGVATATQKGKLAGAKLAAAPAPAVTPSASAPAAKKKDEPRAADKTSGATDGSGKKSLSATTSTGDSAKSVVAAEGSASDMAVVSQTVFNIVELIVTKSFQFENCYAANSKSSVASTVSNSCPIQQRLGECLIRYSREDCEEALRTYEADALERTGQAENTKVARADASVALQRSANVSLPPDIPLEAMKFGIFRCAGTSDRYTKQMVDMLVKGGVPSRRIVIRDGVSDSDLADKGFDVAPRSQVLYDKGVASEVKAVPQLVSYAQQVIDGIKGGGKAVASTNKKDSTPLYMSVLFCDR
jgi:hypothetical protein